MPQTVDYQEECLNIELSRAQREMLMIDLYKIDHWEIEQGEINNEN